MQGGLILTVAVGIVRFSVKDDRWERKGNLIFMSGVVPAQDLRLPFGVRVSDFWLRVCPAMHRQGSDLWGWAAVVPSCRQASVRQKDVNPKP